MPKKSAAPSALPISGKVTARSPYGIKIEGIEDWLNFSKPEYRKEPWEADDVTKGDWVDMDVSGNFIKSIQIIDEPTGERMVSDPLAGGKTVAPEDPFEGIETEPRPRSPIVAAREQSIQNQVALKCAVELAIAMTGPAPEGQKPGPLNADFVVLIYRKFRNALNDTE